MKTVARGASPGAAAPGRTPAAPPCLPFHVALPGGLPYDSCMGTCRETNHSFVINRGEELSHKHTPHKSHSPSPLVFFSTIFSIRSLAKLVLEIKNILKIFGMINTMFFILIHDVFFILFLFYQCCYDHDLGLGSYVTSLA